MSADPDQIHDLSAGEPPNHTILRHVAPNPCAGDPGAPDEIVTYLWRDDSHADGDKRWISSATAWAEERYTWAEVYDDGTGLTQLIAAEASA